MSRSLEHIEGYLIILRTRARRRKVRDGRPNLGTLPGEFRSPSEASPPGGQNLPRAPPPPVRPPPKPPRRNRLNNAPIQRNERPRVTTVSARTPPNTKSTAFHTS